MNTLKQNTMKRLRKTVSSKTKEESIEIVLTLTDLGVEISPAKNYTPDFVCISFHHQNITRNSAKVKWQPSLKSIKSGYGYIDPPFTVSIVKRIKDTSHVTFNDKDRDTIISVVGWDQKQKKKILAKARINITDYLICKNESSDVKNEIPIRLKLYPETKKISKAFVNLSLTKVLQEDFFRNLESEKNSISEIEREIVSVRSETESEKESIQSVTQSQKEEADQTSNKSERVDGIDKHGDVYKSLSSCNDDVLKKNVLDVSNKTPVNVQNQSENLCDNASEMYSLTKSAEAFDRPKEELDVRIQDFGEHKSTIVDDEIQTKRLYLESSIGVRSTSPGDLLRSSIRRSTIGRGHDKNSILAEKLSEKDDPINWAKEKLVGYKRVKITHSPSSWRNGLGFCALIHTEYPTMIPLDELKTSDFEINFSLAFSAAKFLGMKSIPESIKENDPQKLKAESIAELISEIRLIVECKVEITKLELRDFQQKWYDRCGLFRNEKLSYSSESKDERLFRYNSSISNQCDNDQTNDGHSDSKKNGIERVKSMIERSHRDSLISGGNSQRGSIISSCGGDQLMKMITSNNGIDNPTSSPLSSNLCAPDTTVNSDYELITVELRSLELESERVSHEQSQLEERLRLLSLDEKTTAELMPRLIALVNEKQAIVRRQMQLNILEKDAHLTKRQKAIVEELHGLSILPENMKTESDRENEVKLLAEHVDIVNRKNELLHQLDSQEQGIEDDRTIRENLDINADSGKSGNDECILQ